MPRRMIEIKPETESWDAWMNHHRGTKTELKMALCRHRAQPFYAWTEMPPEHARADRVNRAAPKVEASTERPFNVERNVDEIAGRLETRTLRDEVEAADKAARDGKQQDIENAMERAAAAVQVGARPSLKELDDIGLVMIDDPFEVKNGRKPKPLRAKLVNLRDDPVGQMAKRKQIETDQFQAARSWQALHDVAASVGGSRGIDPSAMKVDGGRCSTEPITDVQMASMKRLQQIDRVLGSEDAMIVRRILGDRMSISRLADVLDKTGLSRRQQQRLINRLGIRLRESLDTLVTVMGIEVEGARRRIPKHEREQADIARFADNPPLYQAVREARRKIA